MKDAVKTGVFLCRCGEVIGGRVDMAALESGLKAEEGVVSVESHPRYCLAPGLADLAGTVEAQGINRVLLGACSDRIMKQKFSTALKSLGLLESQIEMVNVKDHVALAHDGPKDELTRKAAALLGGAAAGLRQLDPTPPAKAEFKGAALIVGGGISGFEAARELTRNHTESILFSDSTDPKDILARLPGKYPGSRLYFKELEALLTEVLASPLVTVLHSLPVEYLQGRVGNYRLGLRQPGGSVRELTGSAVILAMDREFISHKETALSGDARIMDQLEFEDRLSRSEVTAGRVVFLVNGRRNGQKAQELSLLAAWQNSRFIAGKYPEITSTILYPADIPLPATGSDLAAARNQGIGIHAYKPDIHPVVQPDYLTFVSPRDHGEQEIKWDTLITSAIPGPPVDSAQDLIRYLPVFSDEASLKRPPLKVKADQEPVEWTLLAGSAQQPCSLDDALHQGKRAAREILSLKARAQNVGLANPLVVVSVDQDLCEGCGLCNEICTCGAVENVTPGKGRIPRTVDPHACDGGGSCAAACPYGAMKVLNNSTQQLEARVRRVIAEMKETDVLGFACSWGGQGAAELAATRGLTYSSRLFMIPVRCLGVIDPTILSMAFLNGANSIMLAGCTPTASCHYGHGVDHTWFRVNLMKKLLSMSGLERQRISLGYVDVNEPEAFVKMVESFISEVDRMGPIERNEEQLKRLLAAHATLHNPRMRWILGASLRRPSELEFPSSQRDAFSFDEVMQDVAEQEYMAARIIGALREAPLSPVEVAQALGERPAAVNRLLDDLVKEHRILCRWETPSPLYTLAKPS